MLYLWEIDAESGASVEREWAARMDDQRGDAAGPSPWVFFGILLGFKLWTLLLVLIVAATWDTVEFILATHVLWITVGAFLLWAPVLFWVRLMRVRARRRELLRAEWEVEDTPARRY